MVKRVFRTALDSLRRRDERFAAHDVLATRVAGLVATFLVFAWTEAAPEINGHSRFDLLVIGAVMALVKMGATVYFHLTH